MDSVRTVQDILFGVTGQTLYLDCPEGRPTSVTSVAVHRWDSGDLETAETAVGTPAVETNPDTTVDAASGSSQADPTILNVAATTGFAVERSYLVTSSSGYREWLEVNEIDSGVSVTAKHPLHNAYTTADTVQSTRITAAVDSTWAANIDKLIGAGPNPAWRVRWVYVVAGVTCVADTYFNLVRYAGQHGVRPQDIEVMFPGWLDRLPTDHYNDQGRRIIDDAYRAVKIDLHGVMTDDAMVANAEIVDELTRYRAIVMGEMARALAGVGSNSLDVARGAYQERLDSLVRLAPKTPIRDTSGAAGTPKPLGLTRR